MWPSYNIRGVLWQDDSDGQALDELIIIDVVNQFHLQKIVVAC